MHEYARYRKIKPEELSEILDRLLESAKGINSLEEWETYIEDYTKRLNEQAKKQEKETEGVLISTMHGVKGLEFEPALEEERRLFYVGMTRAKKKLTLCYVKRQYEKDREPSRFLKEAGV